MALLMSVNLAARQVREPGLVADVVQILGETGWPAELLQLELTESEFMGTTADSLAVLRDLADIGVRIAIDDFGTGYSNLAYLRRLPVHALKLAGPFITRGITGKDETDDVDLEIVGNSRPARPHPRPHRHRRIHRNPRPTHPAPQTRLRHRPRLAVRTGRPPGGHPRALPCTAVVHSPIAATLTGLLPLSEAQHRPPAPALQDVERPSDETTHVQVARPINRASRTSRQGSPTRIVVGETDCSALLLPASTDARSCKLANAPRLADAADFGRRGVVDDHGEQDRDR